MPTCDQHGWSRRQGETSTLTTVAIPGKLCLDCMQRSSTGAFWRTAHNGRQASPAHPPQRVRALYFEKDKETRKTWCVPQKRHEAAKIKPDQRLIATCEPSDPYRADWQEGRVNLGQIRLLELIDLATESILQQT